MAMNILIKVKCSNIYFVIYILEHNDTVIWGWVGGRGVDNGKYSYICLKV